MSRNYSVSFGPKNNIIIGVSRNQVVVSPTRGPRGITAAPEVRSIEVPGTGTIEDDVNALNPAESIAIDEIIIFYHDMKAYIWVGPQPTSVGVGGDYVTVNSDFIFYTATDHTLLDGRLEIKQHPIGSITDLQNNLNNKSAITHEHDDDYQPRAAVTGWIQETDTTRTLVLTDVGKIINCTNIAGCEITIPPNVFSMNDVIHIRQDTDVQIELIEGLGVLIEHGGSFLPNTLERYTMATIVFESATVATLTGALSAA